MLGLTPDWWMAGSTFVLTIATIALGVFTALLWKATNRAVRDTAEGLKVARESAAASQKQAEVAERVGMIQNINPLQGHLRYIASCALYGSRPSDESLKEIPTSQQGFSRLLHRLEWGPAGDANVNSLNDILASKVLMEAAWEQLIPSPHLDEFFYTAAGIVDIAKTARVVFLIDHRIIRALKFRDFIPKWREDISRLHRQEVKNGSSKLVGNDEIHD